MYKMYKILEKYATKHCLIIFQVLRMCILTQKGYETIQAIVSK
jgi:hypothetical protein